MDITTANLQSIVGLFIVTAFVVWGLLEVIKAFMSQYRKGEERPWWYSGLLRAVALLAGSLVGYVLYETINPGFWQWGLAVGACAGALSTIVVAVVKRRLRKRLGGGE